MIRRLYEANTYQATQRLKDLRAGKVSLEMNDLREMFEQFVEGQEEFGDGTRNVDLAWFGAWLLGNHDQQDPEVSSFLEAPGAEILW